MSNSISRSVDLTQQLIFNKNKGREKPLEKRYHRISASTFSQEMSTTAVTTNTSDINFNTQGLQFFSSTTSSTVTTFNGIRINPFPFVNYVEEKIPWRKLRDEGDCFCERHSAEEWMEVFRHYNFPMGTKEQRHEILRKRNKKIQDQLMYEEVCECCGRKFKSSVIPWKIRRSMFYGLCERCSEPYMSKIPWRTSNIKINKRIAWR